jgi:hypothetical protein
LLHSLLVGGACCHGGSGIVRAGTEGAPRLKLEVRLERGVDLREMTEHGQHVDKHEDDSEKEKKKSKL